MMPWLEDRSSELSLNDAQVRNPVLLTNFIDCNSCSAFKFCALDYINVY